jgi:predicted 3-demethylubiquinone-9 3-methyltransferase (glyoxalase superfamily)
MKLNFTFKKWHSLILLLFVLGFANQANAQTTYYARQNGNWNASTTWSTVSSLVATNTGTFPKAGDEAIIEVSGRTVTVVAGSSGVNEIQCGKLKIINNGLLTFTGSVSPEKSVLTCSGVVTLGNGTTSATKGVITMGAGSRLVSERITTSGPLCLLNNRNSSLIACTFEFTGSGTGVVPSFTDDNTSAKVDFNTLVFNPTSTEKVYIPAGLSIKACQILKGSVDFEDKYSTLFTGGESLSMSESAKLSIGGIKTVPLFGAYVLDDTSIIDYTGGQQLIKTIPAPGYKNLYLTGPGEKTLESDMIIKTTLGIETGVTLLIGDGKTLTISGNYYDNGTGCIRGSKTSSIWFKGNAESKFSFDQNILNDPLIIDGNALLNLTIGDESNIVATPDFVTKTSLNIYGNLNLYSGYLQTNETVGEVTLKSDANTTAFVAIIVDPTITGITGNVTVERFIPAGSNFSGGTNLGRGFRALSSSVTGGTVFSNWQENGSTTSVEGSIAAGILTTPTPNTLNPLAVGMHISGTGIPPNTTITGDNGDNTYTLLTTLNDPISRPCRAFADITSTTAIATFRSTIANNIMTVTAPITGTLAVGQKITGMYPAISNIVITELGTGTGGAGTYTIGVADGSLNVLSTDIYYNGANAGFGTHITGKVGTADKLGRVDDTTGFDLTVSGNPSLFTFNETTQGWDAITSTKDSNLEAGTPYLLTIRGDRTIDLALNSATPTNTTLRSTGTIVSGDVPLYFSTASNELNYIGNPYQAPVDLVGMKANGLLVGLEDHYTVFDSTVNTRGGYVTVDLTDGSNGGVGSVVDGTLEPNQAFFIRSADNTVTLDIPSITFQETYKVTGDNTYVPMYRKAKSTTSKIIGTIHNTTDSTKALDGFSLSFSDNYSNTIVAEDAIKVTGNQDEIFASVNGAKIMAIDKRNFPAENDVIALNLTQERLSDYILKFNVSNFDAKDAYLVDAYTKKETALKNNQINSYAFSVDATPASAAADRFSIVFKTATSLSVISNSIEELAVYPNPVVDNKFTIKANQDFGGKKATLSIVNTLGQQVYSSKGTFSSDGSIAVKPTNALNKGIYFLKVAVDGKEETKKLIIK